MLGTEWLVEGWLAQLQTPAKSWQATPSQTLHPGKTQEMELESHTMEALGGQSEP